MDVASTTSLGPPLRGRRRNRKPIPSEGLTPPDQGSKWEDGTCSSGAKELADLVPDDCRTQRGWLTWEMMIA